MNRFLGLSLLIILTSAATEASGQPRSGGAPPATPPAAAQVKPLDPGQLEGGEYSNEFFGLTLSVPRDWVVVSARRRGEIVEESKKLLQAQDRQKQAQVDASLGRSTVLLSLTKLPAGQPANASFMLIAERIPTPSIRTGPDVLRSLESLTTGTNFTVEFQGGIRTEKIGGADFGVATIKNSSPHGVFMQKAYVTTKHGYALQLFYTYLSDDDLPALDSIVKSIKLK
jgi:hypothetical protein